MAKFGNFLKIWGVVVFLTTYSFSSFSQVVYNNGLDIYAKEGAIFFVDGTVQNQSGLIEVEENGSNYAELIIQQDFVNNATAGGDGYYRVLGNWINNNTFNAGTGTVFLEGGNQFLDGSVSTYFNNLTLDGSGLKTQTIDQYCTGILNLKHLELQNETFGFYVQNTNVNAIIRTTGFVSALNGGFLSRKTNLSSMYLFPVGSSLGTLRYRPAEIKPVNANANTYTVRMANVLATTESYDVNALPPKICEVNPEFYHQVNRTFGTAAIELDIFYDETDDGTWDGLASWTTPPDLWQWITPTTIVPGTPFNKAVVNAWNDFSELPYILYRVHLEATITDPGAFCETDASLNLTSVDAGGTWSGTGITNATNGTFNPSTAGAGTHTISYTVGTGVCEDTDQIDITVYVVPDATINDPGDFCLSDAAVNLSASSTGGTWSGTGITNTTNGTFNPSTAGAGTHTITYNVGTGTCSDTDQIDITVYVTPDATITNPGAFCNNDAAINLTASSTGGTWSGTGITNAANGTFNPTIAGSGTHTITYNVGTGSCTDSDNIIITVNATPNATITDPGDFCSTDAALNLSSATTGGTWSGTGITNAANGTFDPASANIGTNNISYTITTAGCTGTANITINVFDTPDATITNPGAFCDNDAAINLTAASTGGTWSGTGITNATNGTFNPTTAGAGTHTITYNVGTGSCTDSDNIIITVNATPNATITDPGDFCSTDAALNLSSATAGGTWSGTGITNTSTGTFNPASANIGTNNISYTLTVLGCTGTANISIDVFDTPDATITNPGAFCDNDAAINLTASSTGGTWSGTGITNATNGTFNPTTAGAGTHTITYNVGTGSCTDSDNIIITVNATPNATITDPGDFCSTDAALNLSSATTGGTWSGTGITNAANGTFDPASANIGTNNISYTITTAGCTGTANITINVFDTPDATITNPGAFCDNDAAINLTAASTGGTWSGTGITNATNGTFNPTTAGAGTHTITYNVGTGSCTDSDNIIITVNATPNATITNPGDFCSTDAALNLSSATAGGTWSGTGITNTSTGTFNPASANIGTNNISYTLTVLGCTGTANISIDVFDTPDATITNPGAFCDNDAAINLTASSTGGTWSGTGITNATNGTFNPTTAGAGTHTITYNVGTGSCTDSDNIIITVNATPNATITDPGDFCSTDAALNLSSATTGGTWSGTGITNAANGTFDPASANIGTNNISYTITTAGCTGTANITINVFDTPDATITNPGAFCDNDAAINLTAASTGGTWSGTGITNATNGTFNPTTAGAGTHTITYNVGTGSCTDSDNIIITVNATPNATITNPGDFCSTDAALNLSSATAGGTWSGTGITNTSTGTFNPASANIGTNNITYTLTVLGCTGTANISIDVFDTPDATITNPGAFCDNDAAINLTASSTGGTWSGTGITNAANGTFNPTTAGAGTHTITYNVGTGSCTNSDNIIITVNATPNATITDPGDFCSTDAALNLSPATAGGTWSGTGITNASTGTFDPASANIGTNNITYTLTVLGCTGTANISIDVFDTPDATITNPGAFCDNDAAINLTASSTGGTWSGTGITNATNGTFNPTTAGAGTHTITYNVGTGSCTDSDNIIITVNATPNATITDPGDFCSTDAAEDLVSATAGGTWSGTGITNTSTGTFNPASANIGTNNISYTLTVLGCTGTANISIDVFDTPDATITNPGAFCDNDAAINLTASSTGGTWSGTGITNATNGTFNPTTAGAGTHTITYNVGTGSCTDSDNIIITVNATPNATITDPGDFCSTDAALNLSSATAGGTWSGTGITNASTGTFDPASANIGTNNITYTITTAGCTGTANITINVFDTPDATITNPGAFCDNDAAINLTASSTGGTWSGTGITNAANGTFNPTIAGSGTHTITYNVGTGSCTDSDNIIITVNATPNATITDPGDFCSTDAAEDLVSATAGGTWSGTGITNTSTGTFNPASANIGTNNISYTLTVLGCTGTANISIDVFDTPDATITNPGAFCDNDAAINLTASSTGGTWSGTGITNATNGTFNPTTAGAGTHTITYNVGTGSCTDSDNIIITVNATPNATITDPGDFCSTDAALNLSSATAGGTWSGTGITNASTGTFDPASANIGTNNITYTITTAGCTGTANITINVFDTPDATITNPGAFCDNDAAINLTASSTGGTWSGTGITNAANGTFNPTIAGSGTHTITYNVGTGSCTDSDNIIITVNATPNATITDPGDFCSTDAALNLSSATAGGTWSGTGITNASTGTFDPASANIGTNNITYTLTVLGCTGTANISIDVFDTPDATITNPGAFCDNDAAINLTAASTGGTWSGTGITNATNGTFNPTTAGAGTHTITYNVGTGSCTDSDNIIITVNATPNATITDPGDFCSTDEPVSLIATPLGGVWSGSGIIDQVNGVFNPNIAGGGIIQIIYTITENGCVGSDIINIDVTTSIDVTIDPVGPFCFEYSIVQLTSETEGGTWSGPGTTPDGQFNIAEAGVGVHKIKYTFTGNCGAVGIINIEVFPSNIYARYEVEDPICQGGMSGGIVLFVQGGTPPYTFEWGEGGYSESIYINSLSGGIYSITINDVNGCSKEISGIIIQDGADDCIEIPDAFTPNADGINDQWIISNIDSFDNYFIQVFNRWGQKIYTGSKGVEPWDGTWNGRLLPTGSYMYTIKVDDIQGDYVGIVTLIK